MYYLYLTFEYRIYTVDTAPLLVTARAVSYRRSQFTVTVVTRHTRLIEHREREMEMRTRAAVN